MLVRRRKALAGVTLAVVVLVVSLVSTGSAKSGSQLKLQASPSGALKFSRKKLTTKAGKVTIVMTNPSSSGLTHGIAVQGKGLDKDGRKVGPGHKSTLTVTLKAGKYTFYCPVDGHKAAGMKGTIVVQK
jgi:uncharacterized cupredoxin-like copper-binding protein